MTDVRIESFPIQGLEYVFVPPGLPLITKAAAAPATTSILIRGGAGTGKTTLSVALAHAISREQKGVALYLTTEFVATELAYKAKTLNLSADSVGTWRSLEARPVGTILAEHLLRTAAGEGVKSVAARKRAAIDAVWELLARGTDEPTAEMQVGPPLRAVVIDAFGLPEIEHEDSELRNELLGLVQTLELAGITTILVEEAGIRGEAWLPFVVDLVFELELWPDPDTGELSRRLKCPKSRYGRAIPGPHDYGIDYGRPSLWPDLTSVGGTDASLLRPNNLPPTIFFPRSDEYDEREYVLCRAGSILVSQYDGPSPIIQAFSNTPGLKLAVVNCGPLTRVVLPGGKLSWVPENEGPFSLAWLLLGAYGMGLINSVLFQELEFFLSHSRVRVGTLRMLEMLRATGLTVCLHGRSTELAPATAVADYVRSIKVSSNIARELPAQRPCSSIRWLAEEEALTGVENFGSLDSSVKMHMVKGDVPPANIWASLEQAPAVNLHPINAEAVILRASAYHLLGCSARAAQLFGMTQLQDTRAMVAELRFHLLRGDDLKAASEFLSSDSIRKDYGDLWLELSAIYAQNAVALKRLAETTEPPAHTAAALIRALAVSEQFDKSAEVIDRYGKRSGLPAWFLARLKADSYLEASSRSAWHLAISELDQLAVDTRTPSVHHAEVLYNLGVARSRLGDTQGAHSAYQQALTVNPYLEAASSALKGRGTL